MTAPGFSVQNGSLILFRTAAVNDPYPGILVILHHPYLVGQELRPYFGLVHCRQLGFNLLGRLPSFEDPPAPSPIQNLNFFLSEIRKHPEKPPVFAPAIFLIVVDHDPMVSGYAGLSQAALDRGQGKELPVLRPEEIRVLGPLHVNGARDVFLLIVSRRSGIDDEEL